MGQSIKIVEDQNAPGSRVPRLRDSHWHYRYSSEGGSLAVQFYSKALGSATSYDRASGYFSSSALALGQREFAQFALAGGKMRLICSPSLSQLDLKVVQDHLDRAEQSLSQHILREFTEILGDSERRSGGEVLAAMLELGVLEIRLAVPLMGEGIFHDKFGIINDSVGDRLGFTGSINETGYGWKENFESFSVFTSWGDGVARIDDLQLAFEQLWNSESAYVAVLPLSNEVVEEIRTHAPKDPRDWLRRVAARKANSFPTRKTLLPHQSEAIANWTAAGCRGVLKHATGSGKTITALEAIRRHIKSEGPAIVLVPSVLLLKQWQAEIAAQLGDEDVAVLAVGGGATGWRDLLRDFTVNTGQPRVVVTTVGSAVTNDFRSRVDGGDHLMIVADEVHTLGAEGAAVIFEIQSGKRLGLSATPERFGDPDGTKRIFDYFGPIVPPEITINDAINSGRLCRYQYHPHFVGLTGDEVEEWISLTKEINQYLARDKSDGGGSFSNIDPRAKMLIFKRRGIIKGASAKPSKAAEIVAREFGDGDRWLVYCNDRAQLSETRERLAAVGLSSFEYHSAMAGDQEATLEQFEKLGGILVAIKCLDEGVDIPSITHALIAASSQNPREFIQRRGRVLRTSPGKRIAVIHDLLISPPDEGPDSGSSMDSIARAEIARAYAFAEGAVNKSAAAELRGYAIDWGVELASIVDADSDEEDEVEE